MVRTITARNVNHAFIDGWYLLKTAGIKENSRNGPVLVAPGPVITTYSRPNERVLFNPSRDANPFFHLMESLWMLSGGRDVEWLKQFSSNIANYAEDDGVMHGAYGYRWRHHFVIDQLTEIIDELKDKPQSRQAVMQMWDPVVDLRAQKRDLPCNTTVYFDCRGGKLNMTVCNRSNDMVWGAYGANVVHFSILQEFIARALHVPMGDYRQFSNNFHVYLENPIVQHFMEQTPSYSHDYYTTMDSVDVIPLLTDAEDWPLFLEDCLLIQDSEVTARHLATKFMKFVALPLRDFYLERKTRPMRADDLQMVKCDWQRAAYEWLKRRDPK